MMLKVISPKKSRLNVPMMEMGMTVPMMSGVFHSWRKNEQGQEGQDRAWMSSSLTARWRPRSSWPAR